MTTPTFSVVVPLYNKADSVAAAINSVLAQTFADFELIVVDDGSTDDGARAVAAMKDARIRVIAQANGGVSRARNTGIAAAQASYVALLDADDVWHADFLQRIHALIKAYPEAAAYATQYAFRHGIYDSPPNHPHVKNLSPQLIDNYFHHVAGGDMLLTASSVCIPRAVLEQTGVFPVDERIGEDQDLWIRLALHGPIAWDNRCSAYYRQDAGAMATRTSVDDSPWPFVSRLLQRLREGRIPHAEMDDAKRYAARHLLGQAGQLVLDGRSRSAMRLLSEPEARSGGLRYLYWRILSLLPASPAARLGRVNGTIRRAISRLPSGSPPV